MLRRDGAPLAHDRLRVVVERLDPPDLVSEVVEGADAVISTLRTTEKGPF